MNNIDLEWEQYLENDNLNIPNEDNDLMEYNKDENENIPKASPIYISTKTKIAYLNSKINLQEIFWLLPILEYHIAKEGIIKKQIKMNSTSQEELNTIDEKLKNETYVDQHIINHIDNPTGRIKFKDVRKISVGLSKKDVLSYRCKKKSAFYNCFVVVLRILWENTYKEIHVKVFNTGKLEIPGIQNDNILDVILPFLIKTIISITDQHTLNSISKESETVLINSNFNCGFYIDREKLFNILRFKYRINSCYDPCSYPGIQCEFYYDYDQIIQSGMQPTYGDKSDNHIQKLKGKQKRIEYKNISKISFMIFRTGSVLIVGKCSDEILYKIYDFIKKLLSDEFKEIVIKLVDNSMKSIKKRKVRKKYIIID